MHIRVNPFMQVRNVLYMDTKCSACSQKVSTGKYCFHHSQAFDSLKEHHKAWIEAYGIISWNNFLNKLIKMNGTGSWIKEVIVVELKG